MLFESGCIHCGKHTYDHVIGSPLCFKHYRQYNLGLSDKLRREGRFEKRYEPRRTKKVSVFTALNFIFSDKEDFTINDLV